ncbi:AzlD domain-containing protein [Polynucleobacter paneuropaeus]|jgi:branched-subunit amino acid transport protein|uniref:AzlD domain-containing protein n=1 Tax=Polynucleobacter paneuropaeus TaxID=2527775 RepID=UPI000DBF1E4A|nr:AzlD domain-containing protein [Polynucleobacter paneuropaeus]AWW45725.1 AzlD domain-containing protein [Polynucleobacter paneuropaeus]AWW47572.1 AzlD domain-containing protein [Polynucleobacter paneuropaeus]MBT8526052.1 AzlD domain-containing protein [Polynucleobacter paneuropaeus]MBT8544239.1 AzlD domain-containing protein [Polynucleobacter paneuropaeus]MBT8546329.1 AzlD domain-containing protein [Polynucleobacter paneuropaeus]
MHNMLSGWSLGAALIGACVGTYICRAIGVLLSSHIHQDSEIFRWLSAVTYAMVAALTIRLILLPVGLLETVSLWTRILICGLSLGLTLYRPGRLLTPALFLGTLLMILYGALS